MNEEVIIVSGLPRSGTSLMMQMLEKGGVEVVTDGARSADVDNPRGYYELEQVKKIKQDDSWLPEARGRAVKVVSQLLYDLPASETYRIVFMVRDMEEMLRSQETMLKRLGREAAPREEMIRFCTLHLEKLHDWLSRQPHIEVLRVIYNDLMEDPDREAQRLCEFLGGKVDPQRMVTAVDPRLYRNRKVEAARACAPDEGRPR